MVRKKEDPANHKRNVTAMDRPILIFADNEFHLQILNLDRKRKSVNGHYSYQQIK